MPRKLILAALGAHLAICASGQVKPNTQTQPSSTNQTLKTVPAAYATGTPVSYVRTYDAMRPYQDGANVTSSQRTTKEVREASQYIDGLGRPVQAVAKKVTPGNYDMVSAQVYDPFGREIYKYLPYVDSSANGDFKNDPFAKQANFSKAFYNPTNNSNGEKFFYGKADVEASPLGRVLKTYAAGNSWAGRGVGVSMQYLVNAAADSVCIWDIGYSSGIMPTFEGYYPAGELTKAITTDEAGNQSVEYRDKEGHVILKKLQLSATIYSGHTGWLCTYYIYDDMGNLRMVVQPLGVTTLKAAGWAFDNTVWSSSAIAKELCFSYEYDARGRLTKKRVPGGGEVAMVYDTRDRLVMTQDPNLRALGIWLCTVYDSTGRPVSTGKWQTSGDRSYHQALADAGGNYPNPTSNYTVLTETYYDDYSWVSSSGSGLPLSAYTGYNSNTANFYTPSDVSFPYPRALTTTNVTRGMVTGTRVNVLNTSTYLYSVSFYDDRGRIVQAQSTNYTGDIDTVINQYSFSGQVLRTLVCHGKGGANAHLYQVLNKNTYDIGGRLTQVNQRTGRSLETVIAKNTYDELSRISKKTIGQKRVGFTDSSYVSGSIIDSILYTYNIRGWLKGINKDYADSVTNTGWYGMDIAYDYGFTTSQLTGNIAGIRWRDAGDGHQRAYGFLYDRVNRLTKADYTQNAGGSTWDLSAGTDFSVHFISYDANGNISRLYQWGMKLNSAILLDSLIYSYVSGTNRLNYVTDKANDTTNHLGDFTEITQNTQQDYWYDGNGNLVQDKNKGITNIHYNLLNLPDTIRITGKGYISYLYTATGSKLRKLVNDSTVSTPKITRTDYAGLFIYQNDTLQYVSTPEGRARPKTLNSSAVMWYDYFEKDHLGNTRVVLTDERQQDVYPAATLENNSSALATEKNYYDIDDGYIVDKSTVTGFSTATGNSYNNNNGNPPYNTNPYASTGSASDKLYKLNGAGGLKTGLGMAIKVMGGDTVSIYAKSFWHGTGSNPTNTYSPVVSSFISAFAGTGAVGAAGKGATATALNNASATTAGVTSWLGGVPNPASSSVPKAYVNWVLFDEQFRVVSSGSGYDLVSTSSDNVKTHNQTVNIKASGYLYVYCSNESNIDVFFDNLQLIHTRGPLLETDNYYPFGLVMAGISSKSAGKLENRRLFNGGNELQNKEFTNSSGLEWYDATNRMYDAQLGRFFQIDEFGEASEEWSPYVFSSNNPINRNDPLGLRESAINESNPNELAPVTVKSYSAKQKKQIYWELRNANIDISRVENNYLRYWLEDYDGVARFMEKVHQETKEADMLTLEVASWLIPETKLLKILRLKKAFALFKLKRGISAFKTLEKASEYGLKSYKELRALIKGAGVEAHHLIEQRFASTLGVKAEEMMSIAVTKEEHQAFTNAWRAAIGYEGSNSAITTLSATAENIEAAARKIYANYPEILKALGF